MPKKICLGPSCNRLVSMKEKCCPSCTDKLNIEKREKNRRYDQYVREDEIVEFYHSREWKRVRAAVLIRHHYLCQHCLKENMIKSAELVHHVIEIKLKWILRYEIDNCLNICVSCHNKL